jgi:hypothetical protein
MRPEDITEASWIGDKVVNAAPKDRDIAMVFQSCIYPHDPGLHGLPLGGNAAGHHRRGESNEAARILT